VLYLPEAHTDSISAIIGEELGFIGVVVLCSVYLLIVARGVRIALAADEEYGSHLAFGLSMLFGVQAVVNLAVAMAMLPTKGLALPFISYGGSSLVVNAAAMGILLNISRPRAPDRGAVTHGPSPEASNFLAMESDFGDAEEAIA
jgi:cell division protein FtsW